MIENTKCEMPKINTKEGKYKYLSLAKLYTGANICENGINESKNGMQIINVMGKALALNNE